MLAGGVGGAKFAKGLRALLQNERMRREHPDSELTIIANVGDDMWLSGLKICPDLDSLMYALAGVNDAERGWGRQGESERVSAEMDAYGVGWPWFTLGDLDLGTHVARTGLLREGLPLSAATGRLCSRWDLGARLLPAADTDVETWVELAEGHGESGTLHFEEWWVRLRASIPAARFTQRGADLGQPGADPAHSVGDPAQPGAGVREAIMEADAVLLAPSNPVVSLGTMLGFPGAGGRDGVSGIPGIAEAVRETSAPVVGVSPIIESAPLRGMARQCLEALGQECTAQAVGLAYGARSAGGLLDGWLVDTADAAALPALREAGLDARAVPLWMTDEETSAALAAETLRLAASV